MKKQQNLIYLIAVVSLVVVAIITTTIINTVKNSQSAPTDIRAKAGQTHTLKLEGQITDINDTDGILVVGNVELSPESRSGKPSNLGTWMVTPPPSFSLASAQIGQKITFVIDQASFNVLLKKVTAVQVTVTR